MHRNLWMGVTLLGALMLTILPMPLWMAWSSPAWVLLTLLYWTMKLPHRMSLGIVWIIGILLDLLSGTPVGEHAFALTVVMYCVFRIYMRLRMYPLLQQSLNIFFFVLLYQFLLYCMQGFMDDLPNNPLYWLSSLTSMLCWPWLFFLMREDQLSLKLH
ncbi:MAG: rod shape-determining protein MreD [Gammaproteobacteria bacterium RIFCSPHIGHO2_12_FULL_42_10]|nr:MAG: rod shape-determining protein MreD [Gammaproteobacteria bacterium RIFCSPHIGHO2_12_FULL_42_10]